MQRRKDPEQEPQQEAEHQGVEEPGAAEQYRWQPA
jgi:hypothetical protein